MARSTALITMPAEAIVAKAAALVDMLDLGCVAEAAALVARQPQLMTRLSEAALRERLSALPATLGLPRAAASASRHCSAANSIIIMLHS